MDIRKEGERAPLKIIALVVVAAGLLLATGCDSGGKSAETTPPGEFNFILKYGVGAKNVLDTFAGTFTKDLVRAGTATTRLTLTPEEMAAVYTEMRRLNILAYPREFAPRQKGFNQVHVTPHPTYYLKVRMDGKVKEIHWEDTAGQQSLSAQPREAVQLRDLIEKIVGMIEAKEEFKKLPQPEGAYE